MTIEFVVIRVSPRAGTGVWWRDPTGQTHTKRTNTIKEAKAWVADFAAKEGLTLSRFRASSFAPGFTVKHIATAEDPSE